MKFNVLMTIAALVAFIFGLGFILAPVATVNLYGNTLEGVGVFVARYFGAALLGYAFLAWLSRNAYSKGVAGGFFAAMVLGLAVSLYDAFSGTSNALVWLNVAIYFLLAVGFGYFAFMKSD
jgi:hypothetical protein